MQTHATLRDKIRAEKIEREARYAAFEALLTRAREAAHAAGSAAEPRPMTVVEPSDPLNPNSPIRRAWHVAAGACGFAWVAVHPANSSFARWAAKNGYAERSAYDGGIKFHIRGFGQSVDCKYAAALAMADVLRGAGLEAYAQSRLD